MPRNGSGQYTLPAGNPVVTNTIISSSGWANPTLSDIAAALTASIAKDGQTVPTANLPMGGFRHTGASNGVATGDYTTIGQLAATGTPTGASLVGFLQSGSGASPRTLQQKSGEIVSVMDFGAVGDGVTNDTVAINAALTYLNSIGGGTAYIPFGKRCLVTANLTVPANCVLKGPRRITGTPGSNASAPYGGMGGALILSSSATITTSSNSSVIGLLIYRSGMTFPAADASLFAGTAITNGGDDAAVLGCLILGFNKAIYSNGFQRPRFEYVLFDCNNGIEITQCFDIPYVHKCHGWPYATIANGLAATTNLRSGDGYYIHDTVDGLDMSSCFAYGYLNNFHFSNISTPRIANCFSDTSAHTNSVGYRYEGFINQGSTIGCQSWSTDNGFLVNTVIGSTAVAILECSSNSHTYSAVNITQGNCFVRDHQITGGTNPFAVSLASTYFDFDDCTFDNYSGTPLVCAVSTTNIIVGKNNRSLGAAVGSGLVGSNASIPSLASANSLNLPFNGDYFLVTGTTSIGVLNGGWVQRTVTLAFNNILQVVTGASMRLSGNTSFNTTAGATLTLRYDGSQWKEIGRSA